MKKIKYKKNNYKRTIKRIILFGIDGLGAFALKNNSKAPFRKILKHSLYSLSTRNTIPTGSATNWMTIFSGSVATQHGFTNWDSDTPEITPSVKTEFGKYPTIFYLMNKQIEDIKMGAFYSWTNMTHILDNDLFHRSEANINGMKSYNENYENVKSATKYFIKEKPDFTFVYYEGVDNTGHEFGFGKEAYIKELRKCEKIFNEMVRELEGADLLDDTLIIIASDHGGYRKGHSVERIQVVEIPLIFFNKNLEIKGEINKQIYNFDIAPTIARLMGLKVPEDWIGKNIEEIKF